MMLMVRTRVPGGQLTGEQLLAELDLCDRFGNGTLRVTSRQALQLHGVLKADLRSVIRQIDAVQLSTLAACGDVNRNVMCCPAPLQSPWHGEMQQLARRLAEHFSARTGAYRDIWLRDPETGEKQVVAAGEEASRRSRSTAGRICRASSKWASLCRTTIASTSTRTIWDCWPLSKQDP